MGHISVDTRRSRVTSRWKPCWWFTVGRAEHAHRLLRAMLPFLRIKRKHAQLILRNGSVYTEKIVLKLRQLNARGVTAIRTVDTAIMQSDHPSQSTHRIPDNF